jgi:hypothetical protein
MMAMKGVRPAPPAMKQPVPLYSIAPQASSMISRSPAVSLPICFVTPS